MLEDLYHRAKFGGARISPDAGVAKNVDFCLVCPSRLSEPCGVRQVAPVILREFYYLFSLK